MPLHKVFKLAHIPTSTYYRNIQGKSEMTYDTAKKVYATLERLSKIWPTGLDDPKKINAPAPKLSKDH